VLEEATFVGFIPVRDLQVARRFYCGLLGLAVAEESPFAVEIKAGGIALRLTPVPNLQPQPFTIAGWQVTELAADPSAVNLDSVESLSVGVLVERLGRLSDARMREVCAALEVAVDCRRLA